MIFGSFSLFLIFYLIEFLFKNRKNGGYLPAGADVASGEAGEPTRGARAHRADATWQGRGWPTWGTGGVATLQRAMRQRGSTWAPVRGATWQMGSHMEGPRV